MCFPPLLGVSCACESTFGVFVGTPPNSSFHSFLGKKSPKILTSFLIPLAVSFTRCKVSFFFCLSCSSFLFCDSVSFFIFIILLTASRSLSLAIIRLSSSSFITFCKSIGLILALCVVFTLSMIV